MKMFSLKFTAHYCIKATPLDLCPADPTADMKEEDNGDDYDDEDDDYDDDGDDDMKMMTIVIMVNRKTWSLVIKVFPLSGENCKWAVS